MHDYDKLGRFIKGRKLPEEFKKKISEGMEGHKVSEETRKKLRLAHIGMLKGIHRSPITEFKKGLMPWNKGKHHSEESKKKMKMSHKGMTGKHHSKETIIKIGLTNSIALKGKFLGEKAMRWKDGRRKSRDGYIRIYKPEHPFCDKNKTVLESHLVVEKYLGRYLKPYERIHHINEIRDDDRPENLMTFINTRAHIKWHNIQEGMKEGEIIFDGGRLQI